MIIDVHAHLGHDVVFGDDSTEEELLRAQTEYGVSLSIVQPFVPRFYPEDTAASHDRIARLCAEYPDRFRGMASINPHFRPEDYFAEASRCIKQLHFVGLKLTPIAHAAKPDTDDGRIPFDAARQLGVPLMVHTGAGIPFSDPAGLLHVLLDYPDLPVVLAHSGTDLMFPQALHLAQTYENVYLDTSWLNILCLRTALKTVGAKKLMFASDHAINIPVELAKYHTLLHNRPNDLQQVLCGTAQSVFRLTATQDLQK